MLLLDTYLDIENNIGYDIIIAYNINLFKKKKCLFLSEHFIFNVRRPSLN